LSCFLKTNKIINKEIHILSTRFISESLLQQAKAAGIHIRVIPFININLKENDSLREIIASLANRDILAVFTSKNSVAGLKKNLDVVPAWQIACLDGKTREAAEAFFGKAAVTFTAADSGALAAAMIRANAKEAVFFCGNRRMDHLPHALRQQGISVREITVYDTIETPSLVPQDYDGILFFSPTAVHSFFTSNILPADCTTFAIGQTTAKAITSFTSNTMVISPVSDEAQMIRHLIKYYNEERPIT
jgi:uroporphyrinogen-III synthase